ncbi:MAG: aldehyde dehydrogenase family protein, partial [Planctomycetota bacterium]
VAFRGDAPGHGNFLPLVVLDHVTPDMDVASFEVFGPVLVVLRVKTEDEAISVANGTGYGLSASVWTESNDRALRVMRRLRAGTVWVNTFLAGAPELPFGGYKMSGLGRELGPHSVLEYTETKTAAIRLGSYSKQWS